MTRNYKITYETGTLTIGKASAPAITWPAANELTYGQKLSERKSFYPLERALTKRTKEQAVPKHSESLVYPYYL